MIAWGANPRFLVNGPPFTPTSDRPRSGRSLVGVKHQNELEFLGLTPQEFGWHRSAITKNCNNKTCDSC